MTEKMPITKIQDNFSKEEFEIGSTFKNVFLDEENGYSLNDLYDYLQTFLNKPFFIQYSKDEPVDSIKIWYDLNEVEIQE